MKSEGYFSNLSQDGRVPLISVKDIGEIAADTLLKKESLNGDVFILGPELLTYDEVSDTLTKVVRLSLTVTMYRPLTSLPKSSGRRSFTPAPLLRRR